MSGLGFEDIALGSCLAQGALRGRQLPHAKVAKDAMGRQKGEGRCCGNGGSRVAVGDVGE